MSVLYTNAGSIGRKTASDGSNERPELRPEGKPVRIPFDTAAYWKAEDKLTADDRRDRFVLQFATA